jgi:hypothetical protein
MMPLQEHKTSSALGSDHQPRGNKPVKITTIALATAFALSGTLAFAQAGGNTAGGSTAAGGPAASKTTTGDSMNGSTTGGRREMKK